MGYVHSTTTFPTRENKDEKKEFDEKEEDSKRRRIA